MDNELIGNTDLKKIKNSNYNNIVIVGDSKAGKSTKIIKLLEEIKDDYSIVIVVSETAIPTKIFQGLVHEGFIFDNFNKLNIKKLIDIQDEYQKKKSPDKPMRKILIIMDDILGDVTWKNSQDFKNIFFSGRNHGIYLIFSVQFMHAIPPQIRSNISYLLILNVKTNKDIKTFFDIFWDASYGDSMKECGNFLRAATSGYYALVIDNVTKSQKMSDKFSRFYVDEKDVNRYKQKLYVNKESKLEKKLINMGN